MYTCYGKVKRQADRLLYSDRQADTELDRQTYRRHTDIQTEEFALLSRPCLINQFTPSQTSMDCFW